MIFYFEFDKYTILINSNDYLFNDVNNIFFNMINYIFYFRVDIFNF